MWPGFDLWTRRHMWVEFVVDSRPCSEGFFGFSGFPPSTKNGHFKFLFDPEKVHEEPLRGNATANSHLFILIYLLLFIFQLIDDRVTMQFTK